MSSRGRPPKPSFDDWECPECANVNFSKRTECNRCRKPKPDAKTNVKKTGIEIGKQAAEKSKGLFSADDWMCTKCGNVNWARRKTCNTCNAPKFQEMEERTGFGGGFNEREGVEYNQREESDGEYDDFGRKKKKFRDEHHDEPTNSSRDKSAEKEGRESEEEHENGDGEEDVKKVAAKYAFDDEEEEEDDDDGDTDKYKLFDDDDEDAGSKSKPSGSSREREGSSEGKKVLSTDKAHPRKRYPGSRSSSSSSSRSSGSRSSSSSSSSSRSSRSPTPSGSKRKSRESRWRNFRAHIACLDSLAGILFTFRTVFACVALPEIISFMVLNWPIQLVMFLVSKLWHNASVLPFLCTSFVLLSVTDFIYCSVVSRGYAEIKDVKIFKTTCSSQF